MYTFSPEATQPAFNLDTFINEAFKAVAYHRDTSESQEEDCNSLSY